MDRQAEQISKISDIRVEIGQLSTNVSHIKDELASTKAKLDSVRLWIAGAAAIITVITIAAPVAARLWPTTAVVAPPQIERSVPRAR